MSRLLPAHISRRPDYARLYLVAEAQRGYFTTRQAHEVGISDRLLTHWVREGRFYRVAHGIYRLRDFPFTPREELMIPLLWAGPVSALSHETALELHGLADVLPTATHITVPPSFTPRRHEGIMLHREPLTDADVILFEDLRMTTIERTLIDCFEWGTDRDQLQLAARQGLERGLVDRDQLREGLEKANIIEWFEPVLRAPANS